MTLPPAEAAPRTSEQNDAASIPGGGSATRPRLRRMNRRGRRSLRTSVTLAGLALALTIAGMLKPVLWDEEVYFQFAQYISTHPFDPYGAPIWVSGRQALGMLVLAPPVLLYWWAGAMALFGASLSLQAIALFPFALIYTTSCHSLARRFAPDFALPLTIMAAASPWALVSFNFMLDFPAVALAIASLAILIRGIDGRSIWMAWAAGAIAGFAIETKYNAAAILPAMLLYGWLARRRLDGVVAALVAGAVVGGCEWVIWLKYGQSHFLLHLLQHPTKTTGIIKEISRLRGLSYGLIENVGPLAIGLSVAATAALGAGRRAGIVVALLAATAFALGAMGYDRILGDVLPGISSEHFPTLLTISGILGFFVVAQCGRLVAASLRRRDVPADRDTMFLVVWLAAEILTYFAMSPFPAARRLGGLLVVATLIAGRRMAIAQPSVGRLAVGAAILLNAVAGLAMFAIAEIDGWNVAATARAAAAAMATPSAGGNRWQLSTLAFDHYLTAAGIPRVEVGKTVIEPGDLIVIDPPDAASFFDIDSDSLQPLGVVRAGINLGVRVSTDFYRSQLPWSAASDTRPSLALYRATKATTITAK